MKWLLQKLQTNFMATELLEAFFLLACLMKVPFLACFAGDSNSGRPSKFSMYGISVGTSKELVKVYCKRFICGMRAINLVE